MSVTVYVVILLVAALTLGLIFLALIRGIRTYLKYRGPRLITCPENHRPAAVTVHALLAGYTTATHSPELRLKQCSRWPEMQGCEQECLSQIERSPEDCLVRMIVTRWYGGKVCAVCGRPIHKVEWLGHKPALLDPEGKTVYLDEIKPEMLPEVLATYSPVCWDCHIASTLMREHPEVITNRPWPPGIQRPTTANRVRKQAGRFANLNVSGSPCGEGVAGYGQLRAAWRKGAVAPACWCPTTKQPVVYYHWRRISSLCA